jgi:hypothetical protein
MAGVKIDSKGVTNTTKQTNVTIDLPVQISGAIDIHGSGTIDGNVILVNDVAGGAVMVGGTPSGSALENVIFQVSASSGDSFRCGIHLFASSSGVGAVTKGIGTVPQVGSMYVYTDGTDLFIVGSDGNRRKVHTTGSA